jgi:peroxiredoxin
MIEEGEQAPRFELPAVRDGEIERVALEEYLGENIVILAFYPADFNPACSDDSTDLDELDLFTMQKDVSILGVSGDSVYSHHAFADEYDLHIPLLSDVHGEVASAYGVELDGAEGYPNRRAVAVIDHAKEVDYTWVADGIDELPNTEEIRERIEGVGGDETAQARYRVGHAHYMEGRRAFTSAMGAYEDMEWMMAQSDFTQAHEEFGAARDEFNTANRFGEDEEKLKYYDRAERKAESLWRAAEWLSDSANTFASGEGGEAERLRQDAEAPLETARDIHEPPDPDVFPPEHDPAEQEAEEVSILPDEETEADTSLGVDIDSNDGETMAAEDDSTADASGDTTAVASTQEEMTAPDSASSSDEEAGEDSIDDDELEEIAAELEQQSEAAAEETDGEIDDGDVVPDSVDVGTGVGTENGTEATDGDETSSMFESGTDKEESDDRSTESEGTDGTTISDGEKRSGQDEAEEEHDAANIEGELEENDIELDLTDPTEGESGDDDDEDEDEELTDDDLGDGDHGVPDSL